MKPELKKLLILNAPYLLFVYLFDKIGQAVRLAPGADLSGKVLSLADGFSAAFATPLPSLAPMDLLIGIVGAVLIRLMVYFKGKNAKKYRKGIEYGSARWGNAEDIKPYTDPVFQNNVLLTQTERLTMNSRPKQPKYARNKNILVIGGSGSGKTRFFVKPNLMQMHSSYVVTDPKGTVLVECGKLLQRGGYRIKVLNTINFKKSITPYSEFRKSSAESGIAFSGGGHETASVMLTACNSSRTTLRMLFSSLFVCSAARMLCTRNSLRLAGGTCCSNAHARRCCGSLRFGRKTYCGRFIPRFYGATRRPTRAQIRPRSLCRPAGKLSYKGCLWG